jgi:hypothetical protein
MEDKKSKKELSKTGGNNAWLFSPSSSSLLARGIFRYEQH